MARRKNYTEIQRVLRDVIANHTSEEDLIAIWNSIKAVAKQGTLKAAEMVFDRIGGKPSVGQTATLIDGAAAEAFDDGMSTLSTDEMRNLVDLLSKMKDGPKEVLTIDHQPDVCEQTTKPVIESMSSDRTPST